MLLTLTPIGSNFRDLVHRYEGEPSMSLSAVSRRLFAPVGLSVVVLAAACKTDGSDGGSAASALAKPDKNAIATPAPDSFKVAVETSKGNFTIMAHRDWAPRGVDRFYHLVRLGYYDDTRFF